MSELIAIELIEVGERLRAVDPNHVEVLADSIRQRGRVLQPITVSKHYADQALRPTYVLLAGAHRVEAAKVAGLREIPAEIIHVTDQLQSRLIEIDENLLRHELNPLDRAVFLAERKRIYEAIHPEVKKGAKNQHSKGDLLNEKISFSKDAAEKTGLGERAIQMAVSIANGLTPEVRKRLAGTSFSKNQSELLLLAKQEPAQQAKIVDLMLGEKAQATSVKAAIGLVGGKPKAVPDASQQQLKRLMDAWRHAGAAARREFVQTLSIADRVSLHALTQTTTPAPSDINGEAA